MPVSKTSLPAKAEDGSSSYDPDVHKLHTLFCGTHVLYTRSAPVRAMVIRTGFKTAKGELVRSILYPKETKYGSIGEGKKKEKKKYQGNE